MGCTGDRIYEIPQGKSRPVSSARLFLTPALQIGSLGVAPAFNLSILCTKASILLFYLRFPVTKWFRIATYIVMFISIANCLTTTLGVLYLCRPISYSWDSSGEGTCINGNIPFLLTAALNVVTDVAILLLPIWLLAPLRISFMARIGVTLVFMAGGLYACGPPIDKRAGH